MKIDVTGIDLVAFAKKVYELSQPRGMGFLHFTKEPLSDEDARACVCEDRGTVLSMDYVLGRGCKMHVWREDGRLVIASPWYDHTEGELAALLKAFNIEPPKSEPHNHSCECDMCARARAEMGALHSTS